MARRQEGPLSEKSVIKNRYDFDVITGLELGMKLRRHDLELGMKYCWWLRLVSDVKTRVLFKTLQVNVHRLSPNTMQCRLVFFD